MMMGRDQKMSLKRVDDGRLPISCSHSHKHINTSLSASQGHQQSPAGATDTPNLSGRVTGTPLIPCHDPK